MVLCPLNMKYSTPCKEECALFYNGGCLITQMLKEMISEKYKEVDYRHTNYYNDTQLNVDEIIDACKFSYKFENNKGIEIK